MHYEDLYDELQIVRYRPKSGFQKMDDTVIRETSLKILLNEDEIAILQALKCEEKELALGFLYNECVINDPDAVTSIEVIKGLHAVRVNTTEQNGGYVPSVKSITLGCGSGVTYINPNRAKYFQPIETDETLEAGAVVELMNSTMKCSDLFAETGCVHTAALSDGEELVHISDDIGRHNCVDKVLGWELMNRKLNSGKRVIVSSGRLSSEIVSKSIRGRVQFLISHSAPTRGAVQLAHDYGITLIGFVRSNRYNIYTHEERIVE
jgi:FdhD protein